MGSEPVSAWRCDNQITVELTSGQLESCHFWAQVLSTDDLVHHKPKTQESRKLSKTWGTRNMYQESLCIRGVLKFVFADTFSNLTESVPIQHLASFKALLKGITYLLIKWFIINSEQESAQYIHSLLTNWDSSWLTVSVTKPNNSTLHKWINQSHGWQTETRKLFSGYWQWVTLFYE